MKRFVIAISIKDDPGYTRSCEQWSLPLMRLMTLVYSLRLGWRRVFQ